MGGGRNQVLAGGAHPARNTIFEVSVKVGGEGSGGMAFQMWVAEGKKECIR